MNYRNIKLLSIAAGLVVLFNQNCSSENQFKSSSISILCQNKLQELKLKLFADNQGLRCDEAARYVCEVRKFNEELANSTQMKHQCYLIKDAEFCVPTNENNFNTAGARKLAGVSSADFSPGGDYNHQEAHCSYFAENDNQTSLQRADGENVKEALTQLVAQCKSHLVKSKPAP